MTPIARAALRALSVATVIAALASPRPAIAEIDKEELLPHADLIAKLVLERIRLQCFVKRSEPHKPVSCPRNTWMTGGGIDVLPPEPGAGTAGGAAAKVPPVTSAKPSIEAGATERGGWSCLSEAGKPAPTTIPATAADSLRAGALAPPPAGVMCYVICCEVVESKAPQPRSRRKARPASTLPAPATAPATPAAPAPAAPPASKP